MLEPSHAFRLANDPAMVSLPFAARGLLATAETGAERTPALAEAIQALRARYQQMEIANEARLAGVEELLAAYGLPAPPRPIGHETARAWMTTITRTAIDWIDKRSADGRAVLLGYRFGELAVAVDLAATGRALLAVAPADALLVEEVARLEQRLARARAECAAVVSRDEPAARFLRALVDSIPDAGVTPLREVFERLAESLAELGRETTSPGRVATLEASPVDAFHLGFLPWSVSIPFQGSALLTAAAEGADPDGGLASIAKLQRAAFASATAGTAASIHAVQLLLQKHGLVVPPPPAAGADFDRWRAAVAAALYDAVCASTAGGAAARLATILGELYQALTLGLLVSLLQAAAPGSSDLVQHARALAVAVRTLGPKLGVAVAHPRLGETARAHALDAMQAIRRAPALDGVEPAQGRIAALQDAVTFLTESRERLAAALA